MTKETNKSGSETEIIEKSEPTSAQKVFGFLTNVRNYQYFNGQRYLTAKQGIPDERYYEDLLSVTESYIPILASPVSKELVDCVSKDKNKGGDPIFIELTGRSDDDIDLHLGCIHFDEIKCLHFRNEAERDRSISALSNEVEYGFEKKVSPEIFEDGTLTLSQIMEKVNSQSGDGVNLAYDELSLVSHWSAAVCYGSYIVDRMTTEDLVETLKLCLSSENWNIKSTQHLELLRNLRIGKHPEDLDDNDKLFVKLIKDFIQDGIPGNTKSYITELREIFPDNKTIVKIDEILNRKSEIFRFDQDQGENIVEKALLLLLLRPEINAAYDLGCEYGAEPETLITTGLLLGVAARRRSLQITFREEDLDIFLSQIEVNVLLQPSSADEQLPISIKKSENSGIRTYEILNGKAKLVSFQEIESLRSLFSGEHWKSDNKIEAICVSFAKNDSELQKYVYNEFKMGKSHYINQSGNLMIPFEIKPKPIIREWNKFIQNLEKFDFDIEQTSELREALSRLRASKTKKK